jgi:hypothetical protein
MSDPPNMRQRVIRFACTRGKEYTPVQRHAQVLTETAQRWFGAILRSASRARMLGATYLVPSGSSIERENLRGIEVKGL